MANVLPPNRGHGEAHFLKLMAEEIENGGYTPGSTFSQESMVHVFRKFRKVYGPIYSDRFLKIKIKQLKTRYQEFSALMSHDDIYWNKQSNVVYGNMKLLDEKYRAHFRYGAYTGEYNYDLIRQIFESGVKFE